jgi:hypothetical protein
MFDALWRTREPRALGDLCDELKISPATAKRLIAFLRTQRGVEVRYDRDRNGYFLARGPQDANVAALLGLSGAEISMLLEAEALLEQFPPGLLRDETSAVRNRLGKVKRQALGRGALKDRVRLRMTQLRQTSTEAFGTVLSALRTTRRLIFTYRSRSRDQQTERSCSPLRLTFYRSNWYLAAWCHQSDELRVFSVDRIDKPRISGEPAFEPPPDTIAAELDSSYGIFTGRADRTAVLRFDALAARWVGEEEWHPYAKAEPQADGGVVLRIPYKHDTELVMDVLRHGVHCEVLAPPELRKTVAAALATAAQQYRTR